jgi:hypothetical protein
VNQPSDRSRLRNLFERMLIVLVPIAGVIALCLLHAPRWQTNDDIGMSMLAHGYGLAAVGSPKLIFSNVLWGYLVRAIPGWGGWLGYSIATFATLMAIGVALLHGLRKLTLDWLVSFAVLGIVLVRPVLFPQFTVNAGLLMVAAIACACVYGLHGTRWNLFAACLLALWSYLIRSQESLLVLLVALPLLPWARLRRERTAWFALLGLGLAIFLSVLVNHRSYSGAEWASFSALNPVRASITDSGAGERLKQHPDVLRHAGYSRNDIDLVRTWFFVDPKIADPERLAAMLAQIKPNYARDGALADGMIGIKALAQPALLPALLAALLLALLRTDRRVVAVWALCIASVFLVALLFRPSVLRVYLPLVSLLLVAPLLASARTTRPGPRWRIVQLVVVTAALYGSSTAFGAARSARAMDVYIRNNIRDFPNDPVVIWGGVFPFESIYPALQRSDAMPGYRMLALGVSTLAPYSRTQFEHQQGHGVLERLVSTEGALIAANEERFGFLQIYCREHLHGQLQEISNAQYGPVHLSRRRCIVAHAPVTR